MKTKLLILATVLLIAGCGKKVEPLPEQGTGFVHGSGLIKVCVDGLSFVYYNYRGGVVQVMDTTGKPMQCNLDVE